MKRTAKGSISWKALIPALALVLTLTMSGCSGTKGSDEQISSEPEESSKIETTVETTTESAIETTSENPVSAEASSTSAESDGVGTYMADNKYILNFLGKFSNFSSDMGLSLNMQGYTFTDNNINETPEGKVSQVGFNLEDDQVMFGMGYNMEKEDMWYVSFEAPTPGNTEWYNKYFYTTIISLANNPIPMGDTTEDVQGFVESMFNALAGDGKDKAIQYGDYVFVYKNTSENRAIFAMDTISYFNAFYKGTIDLTVLGE